MAANNMNIFDIVNLLPYFYINNMQMFFLNFYLNTKLMLTQISKYASYFGLQLVFRFYTYTNMQKSFCLLISNF